MLVGTVHGRRLELAVALPVSSGTARGRLGAADVEATWRTAGDPVTLTGAVGSVAVRMQGRFVLDGDNFFDTAEVSGQCGTEPIHARTERADGRLSTSTVYAQGAIGDIEFSLRSTVGGDMHDGLVHGTVENRPVQLAATRDASELWITGVYEGPDALLLVMVGAITFFM